MKVSVWGAEVIRLVFISPNLSIQESPTNFSRTAHVPPKYCLGPCFVYRIPSVLGTIAILHFELRNSMEAYRMEN